MTPLTFLLTPGGGPGILAQMASLVASKRYNARIVMADCNPASGNLFLPEVDARYRIPPCSAPGFVDAMVDLIYREKVAYWYSGLDEELPVVARHRAAFERAGCQLVLPPPDPLEAALDKERTHAAVREHVRLPGTVFLTAEDDLEALWDGFSGRLLFKIVDSRGGRHIYIPKDREEHVFYSRRVRRLMRKGLRFMAQELIRGDEYNVSMLHDDAGNALYAVSRRKFETREVKSSTTAAVIEHNPQVIDQALAAIKAMELYPGFNNVETIVSHADGRAYFIEVNGGRAAAQDMNLVAAGVPMMDMFVSLAAGERLEPIPHPPDGTAILKIRKDVVVTWKDLKSMSTVP